MFKFIAIHLTEPICTCTGDKTDAVPLKWGIHIDNGASLIITCVKCGTKLTVSNDKFVARFSLDKPYPNEADKDEEQMTAP